MMDLLHVKRWLIALLTVVGIAAAAHAETFPNRTIRIIVPYAPGGSIDLTARVIAKNLQDSVGQSVIVENKPGANAAIGIEDLMRSEPDGHTLIILSDSPVTINVHLSRVNYDPLTDLGADRQGGEQPVDLDRQCQRGNRFDCRSCRGGESQTAELRRCRSRLVVLSRGRIAQA